MFTGLLQPAATAFAADSSPVSKGPWTSAVTELDRQRLAPVLQRCHKDLVDERQELRLWGRNGRIEIVDGLEDTDEEFLEGIGPGSVATDAILLAKPQELVGQASALLRLRAGFCDQPLLGIATKRFELLIQRPGAPPVADAFLASYHAIPNKKRGEWSKDFENGAGPWIVACSWS